MSSTTDSSGQGKKPPNRRHTAAHYQPPTLANYLSVAEYVPAIGDFIIWAGWFKTYYGIVAEVSPDGKKMQVIWESLPYLLLLLTEDEQREETKEMLLREITDSPTGHISVMKHDAKHNATIWYI